MKFSELSPLAKNDVILNYIEGWKETHPEETLSIKVATECCYDSEDDVDYNKYGVLQ